MQMPHVWCERIAGSLSGAYAPRRQLWTFLFVVWCRRSSSPTRFSPLHSTFLLLLSPTLRLGTSRSERTSEQVDSISTSLTRPPTLKVAMNLSIELNACLRKAACFKSSRDQAQKQ